MNTGIYTVGCKLGRYVNISEANILFIFFFEIGNNILIKKTHQDFSTFKVNGKVMNVPTCGIIPTIIDFTFSRIKDPGTNAEIFLDMADDEEMFMS